jgi:hypothetical protein
LGGCRPQTPRSEGYCSQTSRKSGGVCGGGSPPTGGVWGAGAPQCQAGGLGGGSPPGITYSCKFFGAAGMLSYSPGPILGSAFPWWGFGRQKPQSVDVGRLGLIPCRCPPAVFKVNCYLCSWTESGRPFSFDDHGIGFEPVPARIRGVMCFACSCWP